MPELTPAIAANLAFDVYSVHDESFISHMLKSYSSIFSNTVQPVKAAVGFRTGGKILKNYQDTFCVGIKGEGHYSRDLFLIFRGTIAERNNGADWVTNSRMGTDTTTLGVPLHLGFCHVFDSVRKNGLKGFVSSHLESVETVHCIGHSLGGAIASLTAFWVAKTFSNKDVKLYTFGAPKVGHLFFSLALKGAIPEGNIHRVYDVNDPTPMVPVFPYIHYTKGYSIGQIGNVDAYYHNMEENYIPKVSGSSWKGLAANSQQANMVWTDRFIESWLRSNTPLNPSGSSTWWYLDAALSYVIKLAAKVLASAVQLTVIGASSIADRIAWTLSEAAKVGKEVFYSGLSLHTWIFRLVCRMLQMLGMKAVSTLEELTDSFLRFVLARIMDTVNRECTKALTSF